MEFTSTTNGGNEINPQAKNIYELGCKVDYRVYWYGDCEMWIDYVRVENEAAQLLFNGDRDFWIEEEVALAQNANADFKFYIEEFEFNNIPCMAYVNNKLHSISGSNWDLMCQFNEGRFYYHIGRNGNIWQNFREDAAYIKRNLIDKVGLTQFFIANYPFYGGNDVAWYKVPNTLPHATNGGGNYSVQNGVLANCVSPNVYDDWLQNEMEAVSPYTGTFIDLMKLSSEVSKSANIPHIQMVQAHMLYWQFNDTVNFPMREPTNEELAMNINVAVSYGAKGICEYEYNAYNSFDPIYEQSQGFSYGRGLVDPVNAGEDPCEVTPRTYNAYGQNKWASVIAQNHRLKMWGPTLMTFDDDQIFSYSYRVAAERGSLLSASYFSDIISYKTGTGVPVCTEDKPDTTIIGDASPSGLTYECKEDRYFQVATFEKTTNDGNYFMIVNRRCSPYIDETTADKRGGKRFMQVVFRENHEELSGFNNWLITDVLSGDRFTFAKNNYQRVNLGWFMPGEGRLYKVMPVMKSGGTLIASEDVSGQTFTCEDTVYNGGFNITIDSGSTVSFTDSAAIIMTGGTFQSGVLGSSSGQLTTFKGEGSSKWSGLRFTNANVKIYNTKFEDISSPSVNYAVSMYNCPLGDIRGSQFVMSTDTSGAVQSVYATTSEEISYQGMYFISNTIAMNTSRGTGICVQGFGGMTMDHFIVNSKFDSDGYASGIMLSNVTGGSVKRNTLTGFSTAINALASTVDIAQNVITNTTSVSKGISSYSLSALNLAPSGSMYTGGYNTITNTYGASVNIETDNSMPLIEYGNNTFDIDNGSLPYAYHLYGSFWEDSYPVQINGNCYKLNGTPVADETYISSSITAAQVPVVLTFKDLNCGFSLPGYTEIVDLGSGIYDTIPSSSEGLGGSFSSLELTPRQMYAGLRKQLARRNYEEAKSLCYDLIGSYADSLESIASLQTLYLCTIRTDTSEISGLKAFYETLILNHGNNGALVTIANYMSQKCKVLLGQYSSAMTGFQQIINANQYNYLGLVARWDYMATSLLAPGGGGMPDVVGDVRQLPDLNTNNGEEYEFDESYESGYGDDKNPFTKEEKKQIYTSVKTAFETAKNDDDRKIKTLEDNSKKGDVNSTRQLQQMQTLKQIVKTEKPHSIIEHIRIVGSDMQKVFGNTSPVAVNKDNSIPIEFSLGQNYPNPFNPVTTIKYALPHDAKVVIKIYDILGREVKMLINQQQTAGYYDVKFDGSVFASGVYFYRIEAGDFVQSKKMVLVK